MHIPSCSHSSGVLESNSVLSNISSGKKLGNTGLESAPRDELLNKALDERSVMGISSLVCTLCLVSKELNSLASFVY